MTTLQDLVEGLSRHSHRQAVGLRGRHGIRWWSYQRLYQNAHRAAWLFSQWGIAKGDAAVLWAPNSPEWTAFLFGAALRGVTLAPVDALLPATQVETILRRTGATVVIHGPGQDPRMLPVKSYNLLHLERVGASPPAGVRVAVSPEDPAVILFTSGSTGEARGVVLTHANLVFQTKRFEYWQPVTGRIPVRLLALSPLSHIQGLMLSACVPLHLGLSALYSESVSPWRLIRTIKDGRVMVLSTVPRVLDALEQMLQRRRSPLLLRWLPGGIRLPFSLRLSLGRRFFLLLVGGATLAEARERFWRRSGCVLVQGYGSTETSAFVTVNRPFVGRRGSIGRAIHEGSVRLSEDGEILVRGPHVSPGYLGSDAGSLAMTADGYIRTGDLATMDAQRRLYFAGRKQDLIVTAEGHNVNPLRIESALAAVAGVRDSVALGVDKQGLEEVHAVLLLDDPAKAPEVVRQANANLLPQERIRAWTVWQNGDFPRGPLYKVRRAEVAAHVASGDGRATPAAQDTNRVEHLAREILRQSGPPLPERLGALRDLGLDSIGIVQLVAKFEEESGLPVDYPEARLFAPLLASPAPAKEMPRWPEWPGMGLARAVCRGVALHPAIAWRMQVRAAGDNHLGGLQPPFVFTYAAENRQHPADTLAIYRALPRRLSRTTLLTLSPQGFEAYLDPKPKDSRQQRLWLAFLFHFGIPACFPSLLLPSFGATREALERALVWMDRGYNPILLWGPGSALMAVETQATVVPVRLVGNEGFHRPGRPEITVQFGPQIRAEGGAEVQAFHSTVEVALRLMASRAHRA